MGVSRPQIPQKNNTTIILDGSGSGVIDLNQASLNQATQERNIGKRNRMDASEEMRASLRVDSTESSHGGAQFVVLEQADRTDDKNFPFSVSKLERLVGIIIPKNSSAWTKKFFAAGQVYRYRHDADYTTFRVRDIFTTPHQAEIQFPEVSTTWHTITTAEARGLGRGPWIKLGGR
jgi:hypothetical protein